MHFCLFLWACVWTFLVSETSARDAKPQKLTCSTADVAVITGGVKNAEFFCGFVLDHTRTRSPFPSLTGLAMSNACQCFLQNRKITRPFVKSGVPQLSLKAGCSAADVRTVAGEFKNIANFCNFFLKWSQKQSRKPIKALSLKRTISACTCYLNPVRRKTTTTTRKQSSALPTSVTRTSTKSTTMVSTTSRDAIKSIVSSSSLATLPTSIPTLVIPPGSSSTPALISLTPTVEVLSNVDLATTTSVDIPQPPSLLIPDATTLLTTPSLVIEPVVSTITSSPSTTTTSAAATTVPQITTTFDTPFCSSLPVKSLFADAARTQFCWDVKAVPTPQTTTTTSFTPSTTITVYNTIPTTVISYYYVPTISYSPSVVTGTTTTYSTTCVAAAATSPRKRDVEYLDKRELEQHKFAGRGLVIRNAPTPAYLSMQPTDYVTSACDCQTDLPGPNTVTATATLTLATATSTTTVDTISTTSSIVTSTSGTSISASLTTVYPFSVTSAGTAYFTDVSTMATGSSGAVTSTATYLVRSNVRPVDTMYALGIINCAAGSGYSTQSSYIKGPFPADTSGTCANVYPDCYGMCITHNIYNTDAQYTCTGIRYDVQQNFCIILYKFNFLKDAGKCANVFAGETIAPLIAQS